MSYEKIRAFIKFFVTPNWDFTEFLFGKMPQIEGTSLLFSMTICIVYFVIMLIASIEIFKRKDINRK